jgi:UDP-glucose 4-epimerase
MGQPKQVMVFSRDETKQHYMRLQYARLPVATEEIIYKGAQGRLAFHVGDVRDYASVVAVIRRADVVFNAAAMKQVPTCEYFPGEAVETNVLGPENIVRAIRENDTPVETVVGISTDKACKPVNVMGMTKALQERIFLGANLDCPDTRFICVRYGNVISSRGSVVPLFLDQIRRGGPVSITVKEMTRFLLTLDQAVDTIFAALRNALPGETYVPKVPSARMLDIATILIGSADVKITYTGIRPGEKIHEILVSEEECHRTLERDGYFVIEPILQEIRHADITRPALTEEYSSAKALLSIERLRKLINPYLQVADPEEPT